MLPEQFSLRLTFYATPLNLRGFIDFGICCRNGSGPRPASPFGYANCIHANENGAARKHCP